MFKPNSLRHYAALLLHNTPHDRGRKQPLSPAGNQSCVRGSEKGIILLSGHNGVATRFRRIIGSSNDRRSHMMSFVPLFAMPPPYFPASSLAVMLLLAAVATVPPLALHRFRHRGPYTARQKVLSVAVGAVWAVLTIPELVRLSSFPEALACWIQHSAFVLAVSAICTVVAAIGSRGTGRGRASDETPDAKDSRAASSVRDNPKAASH